jgi:hypothetical protein
MKMLSYILCIVLIFCAISCTPAQTEQTRTALNTADQQLSNQVALLKAQIDASADVKTKADLQKALDEVIRLQAQVATLKTQLDSVVNPDGSLNSANASAAIGTKLPYPWNLVFILGVPAVVGLAQQLRVNSSDNAAKSLINAVNAVTTIPAPPAASTHPDITKHPVFVEQLTPKAKRLLRKESIHSPAI